jgi:3-oxoacyl-[acyl-carrier-protein] synthase III
MKLASGAPGARILGLGDHRPAKVVSNVDLEARIETSDTWIRERTGIVTRRVAADDESVLDMAAAAAAKALAAAGVAAGQIDLVLVATCSAADRLPTVAPQLADRLGMARPGALDVNAACAGFCYALAHASDAVRTGSATRVLVVGAEKLSSITDWTDRSTCILFADGAGAAVVGPSDEPGIGPVVWGSEGDRGELITVRADDPYLRMDGPAVFRWATTKLTPVALAACERAGLTPADLRAVVLHQANNRIIDVIVRALRVPHAVIARDIVDSGNTSAASIPMALSRLIELGEVSRGDPALLLGFGSGLTYAGQVVLVP